MAMSRRVEMKTSGSGGPAWGLCGPWEAFPARRPGWWGFGAFAESGRSGRESAAEEEFPVGAYDGGLPGRSAERT